MRFLLLLAVVAISASTTVAADHWRRDVDRVPVGVLASLPAACLAPDSVDFVDLLESLSRVSPVSNLKTRSKKIERSGRHTNDPLLQSGRNLRGGAIYVYNATAFLLMASRIKFSSIFNCGPSVFRRFITWTDRSFKGIYNLWRRRPYP